MWTLKETRYALLGIIGFMLVGLVVFGHDKFSGGQNLHAYLVSSKVIGVMQGTDSNTTITVPPTSVIDVIRGTAIMVRPTTTSTTVSTVTPRIHSNNNTQLNRTLLTLSTSFKPKDITVRPSTSTTVSTVTPSIHSNNNAQRNRTLLTLFTSFKPKDSKRVTYTNVLQIWPLLKPYVNPILFCDSKDCNASWSSMAQRLGWTVLPVPKYVINIPVLRSMYMDVREKYDSEFYCYANGDILFDNSLIQTLLALVPQAQKDPNMLIVGRRTNYKINSNTNFTRLDQVTECAKAGKLFTVWGEDYFITTKYGFPWDETPDFVVGRRGYDNWLVRAALKQFNLLTVEATKTILALHETDSGGNGEGSHQKNPNVNMNMAGAFDASLGITSCAPVETQWTANHQVRLVTKQSFPCAKLYKGHKIQPKTV